MWRAVAEVATLVSVPAILEAVRKSSYADVTGCEMLEARKTVKEDVRRVLKGWIRNSGDEGFEIGPWFVQGGEK
jgi:tRNA-specific adenosine deaminase 1